MYRYSLNFNKIIRNYLSVWLKPIRYAWLTSLISPLYATANSIFVSFRSQAIETARYNCQTVILQSILNKVCETGNKTDIYIKNSDEFITSTYLHNEDEGYSDLFLFNEGEGEAIYLFNEGEYDQPYSFTVYVPVAIYNASFIQIKGWIDKYKLTGTTYNIIAY